MNEIIYPPGCKDIQVELANDELIRRLKKIQQAFQNIDQSAPERYKGLALYLGCDLFLQHEHEDVQLLVACCLADIFRIYAPDSPFEDPTNLKNIFVFLANQLKGLKDNSNPSFKRYFYLLENLECVKTFQLCTELDESQEIIATLFESAFKIVNEKTTTKVKSLLFELLCPLLNESDQISSRVLDTLFARIIEPQKSNNKEAYTLAVNLLKRGNQHFEFLVQNHLNNILLTSRNNMGSNLTIAVAGVANLSAHSNNSSTDSSFVLNADAGEHSGGVTGSANQFISDKLCLIIYELNTIRYAFLELLMPQLEYKLKSSDLKERREYTKLLSKMFSEKDSKLAKQLPQLWEAYLERFADMNEDIRKICVQHICEFLVQLSSAIKPITSSSSGQQQQQQQQQPASPASSSAAATPHHILEQIVEQIKNRALDADEAIRYEVVQEILKAIKLDSNLITLELLNVLKERTLDIKIRVRKLALQGLAALYKKIHSKVYGRQTVQIVSWIPSKIMKIYYQDSSEDKLLVERLLNTSIVPYTLGAREKMAQLYYAYCTFDEFSVLSLVEIMKNRVLLYQLMRSIIDAIEAPAKTPELEARLARDVMLISANLLDTAKGNEFMKTFLGLLRSNLNLKKYFKNFVSLSCSSATAMQLLPTILQNMSSLNQSQMTMGRRLIERMSSLIIDKECLQSLLELVEFKVKQKLTLKQRRLLKRGATKKAGGGASRRRKGGADSDYDEDEADSDEDEDSDDDQSDQDEQEAADEMDADEPDEEDENGDADDDDDDDADSETRENAETVKMLVKHIDDDGQKGLALVNMILSIHGNYGFNNLATYEKLFTFTNSRKDHVVSSALKILGTYFARPPAPGSVTLTPSSSPRHLEDELDKDEFDRINDQYLSKLRNFSVHGKPKQAKYSLYVIHHNFSAASEAESVLSELRSEAQKEIQARNGKTLITSLITLGHICYLAPQPEGKELKDFVSKTVVKELLMLPPPSLTTAAAAADQSAASSSSTHNNNTTTLSAARRKANLKLAGKWCENEEELPLTTRSRIEAIKLVVRWCLGLKSECDGIIPTLKILTKLLKDNSDQPKGESAAAAATTEAVSAAERARIRSICGNQLLKLAQEKSFRSLFTAEFFHVVARLIIDPVTNVRDIFVKKLKKGLVSARLPYHYMAMFALCGYDTSRERKMRAKKIFSGLVKNMRQIDAKQQLVRQKQQQQQSGQQGQPTQRVIPEMCLSYAISLLAHNIKIESVKDDLKVKQVKECVVIVLDPLLEKPDGYQIAYIKNLLGKIKTCDDGLAAAAALQARTSGSQQYPATAQHLYQVNKNLCTICEIFLFHMHAKSASSFTNKEFKFDVRLPLGFFTPKEKLNGAEAEQQQRLNEELQRSSQSELREVLGGDDDNSSRSSGKPDEEADDSGGAAGGDKDNKENNNGQRKRPTTSKIEIVARKRKSADEDGEKSAASTPAQAHKGGSQAKNAKASKTKSPLSSSTSSKQNDSNAVESDQDDEDEEDVPLGSLIGRSKNSPSPSPAAAPAKAQASRRGARSAAPEPARSRSATPPAAKRNKKSSPEVEETTGRKSVRKQVTTVSPSTSVSSTASSAKPTNGKAKPTPARGQKKKEPEQVEAESSDEQEETEENDENDSTKGRARRSARAATTSNKKTTGSSSQEAEPSKKVEEPTSQRPRRAAATSSKK